jgi:hypothetical protein
MQSLPRSPWSRHAKSHFAITGLPLVAVTALGAAVLSQVAASAVAGCSADHGTVSYSLRSASTVKSVNLGLLERGPAPPPASLASVVTGYIIEGRWNRLQPTAGGPLVTTTIDRAVAAVRAWNAANPTNQRGLRLRIASGIYAPDWVKAMSGGPVTVTSASGSTGTAPRWWTQPVEDAYTAFIAELAAYTDTIPEIREVTVGATMEFFGEIFIRFPGQNAAALTAAGFTQAADLAAIESSFRANLAFQHTTTQIDVNAYQQLTGGASLAITQQLMTYALGIGLVHVQFANASLNVSGNGPLYALMQGYGPRGSGQASLTFQSMPNVTSVTQVLQRALSYGASSLELPANPGSASTLAPFETAFDAVAAGSISTPAFHSAPSPSPSSSTAGTASAALRHGSPASLKRLASAAASALSYAAAALSKGKPAAASTKAVASAAGTVSALDYTASAQGVC